MKKKILIICMIFVLIIGLVFVFLKKDKTIDFEGLRTELLDEYREIHEYDYFETSMQFGIDSSMLPDSLFLSDYTFNESSTMYDPNILIIVIKSDNVNYYYDLLDSFIYTYTNNVENNPKLDLFKNAIVKKKKNLVYLILSNDNKNIENILNKYL